MKDVAILVTTFERPFMCLQCVKSIRQYYPNIHLVVSDNGKNRWWFRPWLRLKYKTDYIKLPFDSGLSKSRNVALGNLKEKYIVICDDDFEFTEETKLESFYKILEARKEVGLVAGVLRYGDKVEPFSNELEIIEKYFQIYPIKNPKWFNQNGVKFHFSDYVYNFFMMRNVPDFRWDEDYKIGKEHIDFFLKIKVANKWRIVYAPSVIANHYHLCPTGQYKKYRHRIDSHELFHKKTGYIYGFSEIMPFIYDEKEKRMMPYPEWIWKNKVSKRGINL